MEKRSTSRLFGPLKRMSRFLFPTSTLQLPMKSAARSCLSDTFSTANALNVQREQIPLKTNSPKHLRTCPFSNQLKSKHWSPCSRPQHQMASPKRISKNSNLPCAFLNRHQNGR